MSGAIPQTQPEGGFGPASHSTPPARAETLPYSVGKDKGLHKGSGKGMHQAKGMSEGKGGHQGKGMPEGTGATTHGTGMPEGKGGYTSMGKGSHQVGSSKSKVQRDDGVKQTLLRKRETLERTEDVWLDDRIGIPNGEEVEVLQGGAPFSKVRAPSTQGHIQTKFLEMIGGHGGQVGQKAVVKRTDHENMTMLRKTPTTERADHVFTGWCVGNGTEVVVLETLHQLGFTKVATHDNEGLIQSKFLV